MEDEKLADKLLDRVLMVLMPYDQIDVERVKAKLTVVLDDYQISPKQEALAVYTEGKNDYYLRKFLLAKAVAGRQERTLRQYKDEVGRALRGIGKDADTITADDIQVYLAKVLSRGGSKCYCDNIRRDLSSFYNWLYREEIIRTNPMNKIDNIKFKREKEKALTDMEIEMMRQACQTTMQKAIMEMLLSTGCRAAELVSIKIADMDEDTIKAVYGDGIYNDEHDLDTAVLMENAQVNPMKMLMVLLFALTEPVNHRVHDTEWLGGFYKCIKDDESVYRGIYSALDGIGYEISDMEKSLLDGTHPSYEGAEEES